MIEFISFNKDHKCFAAGSGLEFKAGINLIVGDQGCGKSTLLEQIEFYSKARTEKIQKKAFTPNKDKCKIDLIFSGENKKFGYFDFEKHNPRTQPSFDMGYGYDSGFQIASMFASHGQSVLPILRSLTKNAKDCVAILDEPDMALSPRSIFELINDLKRIDTTDCNAQLIMAVHNPLLIAAFPLVCSLEHERWMPSDEFLALQASTKAPEYKRDARRKVVIMLPRTKLEKAKDATDNVVDSLLED